MNRTEQLRAQAKLLYLEMANLTGSKCNLCSSQSWKNTCCAPEHCESTATYAKEAYGIELPKTKHATLPFMGANGCTVEPHLRPVCAIHHCQINSTGMFEGDEATTEKYFDLREQLDSIEWELYTLRQPEPEQG